MLAAARDGHDQPDTVDQFRRGFLAMLPLWAGVIPFGIAFSLTARDAGMTALDIQLMSLTVFTAAAQVSAVALMNVGASTTEILITTLGLGVHLPLIGAAVDRELRLSRLARLGAAWLLTDATYAVSAALGPLKTPVLFGAGVSMYLGWNAGTALGLLVGEAIPDPQRYGLDFVVPLTFLAVVLPMIRNRVTLLVVGCSAAGTLLIASYLPTGFAILLAALPACLLGARLTGGIPTAGRQDG